MKKVALIIIYNHHHVNNIEILDLVYKNRFSNIYHLVPFYQGSKENVIPVYECSYYFQGYVAQGLKSYYKKEYQHYIFVADDLLLNPAINELNYDSLLKLDPSACFLPGLIKLHECKSYWHRVREAYNWSIKVAGIEADNQLPEYELALRKFEKFNLEIKPLSFKQIWESKKLYLKDVISNSLYNKSYFAKNIMYVIINKKYDLKYPMVGSYSDMFVVSSDSIKKFSHLCGVFAATKLHVEVGLPTSLVLSSEKIITKDNLNLRGKALWSQSDFRELDRYSLSLKELINNFPENYIYLHPIKLSKWKIDI